MDGSVAAPAGIAAGSGGLRSVVEACLAAIDQCAPVALGLVVATDGSTYAKPGAALVLGSDACRRGWISGGCLEPGLDAEAAAAVADGEIRRVELDTRHDADLFFGSRLGCRGLLHVVLLPVGALAPLRPVLQAWTKQAASLHWHFHAGELHAALAGGGVAGTVKPPMAVSGDHGAWQATWQPAQRLLLFGAGPETETLVPWLRTLGWYVDMVERRPRWRSAHAGADRVFETTPEHVAIEPGYAAALVMNHDFELDLAALRRLADSAIGFVGLLGPPARRDDLLALLPSGARQRLLPRLHAPVGLTLGGRGPEAISLAIAAQLQAQVVAPHTV